MSKNHRLTPQIILEIGQRIKAGAFEHVACESVGVPYEVYQQWLELARQKRPRKIYRELLEAVGQAKAKARLTPEVAMRNDHPRLWLLQGPGKETTARPGWSSSPHASPDDRSPDSFITAELLDLIAALLAIVQPYSEIRMAFVSVLDGQLPQVKF